jgi:hypothetical protein
MGGGLGSGSSPLAHPRGMVLALAAAMGLNVPSDHVSLHRNYASDMPAA